MKRLFSTLALAAVAFNATATTTPAPVPAGASATATLAKFYAALAAGDKRAAEALLAPDVTIYESGFVEASRDAYAGHHLGADMAFAKTATRKVLRHTEKMRYRRRRA